MTAIENEAINRAWVAIAYGALDVRESESFTEGTELLVVPTLPAEPMALQAGGADLWWRLLAGPLSETELTEDELEIVEQMEALGIASQDANHPNRFTEVAPPWLSSPLHELVYALVQSVADAAGIDLIFIKGPVLHKQGLREREHSGDVDVWVEPSSFDAFSRLLEPWGWTRVRFDFVTRVYHSVTLRPASQWACEIDVHFRFPGIGVADAAAFASFKAHADRLRFGGVSAESPGPAWHVIIHALHKLRPVPGERASATADQEVVAAIRGVGPSIALNAAEVGALAVLKDAVEEAFPEVELPELVGDIPEDWVWRLEPNRAKFHWAVLRSLPWRQRPAALKAVLWPSESTAQRSAQRAGRSGSTGLRARVVRLRYGFTQLFAQRK